MPTELRLELDFRNKRYKDALKGLEALRRKLDVTKLQIAPSLRQDMQQFLESVADALATRHGTPWPGGTGPMSLSVRSGRAVRSIRKSVKVTGTSIETIKGEIGGVFYLTVHERGATIRPKKAKYLAIPLPAALKPDGTPIEPKGPRAWAKTFFLRSKKGNLLIVQKQQNQIVPLYVLKTMVKIPPRLGMQKTLEAGTPYFVDRAVDNMVKRILQVVGNP